MSHLETQLDGIRLVSQAANSFISIGKGTLLNASICPLLVGWCGIASLITITSILDLYTNVYIVNISAQDKNNTTYKSFIVGLGFRW